MINDPYPTSSPFDRFRAGQLTIWCHAPFTPPVLDQVRRALAPHRLVARPTEWADVPLSEADVAVGQPDPQQVIDSRRLRWVHLTTAGYTRYDTIELRSALASRGGILTNSSSVYDEPCAQHVLAMMMALARQLPVAWADQQGRRYWPQSLIRGNARLLDNQTAVVFGYGAIGRRLSELLLPLRPFAFRRSIR